MSVCWWSLPEQGVVGVKPPAPTIGSAQFPSSFSGEGQVSNIADVNADDRPVRPLSIAICGIRGIPACYGGFETFAEEISTRLVKRGHLVRVYGRTHVIDYRESHYKGVEIKLLPAIRHKYLETISHSFLCFLHLLTAVPDVLLVCNAANSPFLFIPKLRRIPTAVNLDGVERKRAKWNLFGRAWYVLGEIASVLFATKLISDAEVIRDYYEHTYRAKSSVIAYGYRESVEVQVIDRLKEASSQCPLPERLAVELGVTSGKYILYVSRLEPENNAHIVVDAFRRIPKESRAEFKLLIVGDAPYAKDYILELKQNADEDVIFAGYRFGDDYLNLQLSAYLYVQATEVGGTHPALVESMGFGNAIVANSTPENMEVLSDAGVFYRFNDSSNLSEILADLIAKPDRVFELRLASRKRATGTYSWDNICSKYEALFASMVRK